MCETFVDLWIYNFFWDNVKTAWNI